MCGIGGVLRIFPPGEPVPPHHESIPESWLDTLDDAIKHRGPDGQGRFRDRAIRDDGATVDIALVHRRLSIIDHEGGAQPMVHLRHPDGTGELLKPPAPPETAHERARSVSDGSHPAPHTIDATHLPQGTDLVAVAFNGCIYNHRELRKKLEALGHRFVTDHADTEVLIHAWRAWGLGMQDELDGMYAALIWDRRTGQLAWGRDMAGEKPLAIADLGALSPIARVLCSSPAGLTRFVSRFDTPMPPPMSVAGVPEWVRFGASGRPTPGAYHEAAATFELCPGWPCNNATHPATQAQARAMRGYAAIRTPTLVPRSDQRRHEDQLPKALATAVTSRLDADVPLGLFLSGGLDSALIAAIAKQHRPDIKAFTVRMPDARLDESEAAAETAAHLALDHTVIDCDPNAANATPADDLVRLIEQLGLPFGDSSLLPTYWVCRAAREHITVALSGDGGDELFGGYRRHTINPTLNRYRHLLRLIPDRLLDRRRPGSRSTYLARLAVAARDAGYLELLAIFPTPDLRRLVRFTGCAGIPEKLVPDRFCPVDDPLRHDFLHYLPDDLLRKTDTASMAVALEVRAPLLARDLVDAALRTPLDVLMPKGQRKGLLKQVAGAYLPDHIINRPKQGFAIPIGEWFRTDFGALRQLLHDHLLAADPFPGLAEAGIDINTGFVHRMLREHDAAGERSLNPWHARDHSQRLYMLLVLSIWCRWLDRTRREAESPATPA
jgi:asparagine synthase (glutamine-hydrolysing)